MIVTLRGATGGPGRSPVAVLGTADGRVYGSRGEAESWELLAAGLPPVSCVALG